MKNINNIFKPAPERFKHTVRQSIEEAQLYGRKSKRVKHPARIVAAAALLLAVVPTSVYAGSKLFSAMEAGVRENKGVEIKVNLNKETKSPKYVKLCVKAPEGFELSVHTEKHEELFYSKTDGEGSFSFYLSRPSGKRPKELLDNVNDYKEKNINGHQAVVSKPADGNGYTRAAIYFEDVNIILITYLSPELSKSERDYIIDNVNVIKGTKADHTIYNETANTYDKAEVNDNAGYKYKIFPVRQYEKIDFGRMNIGDDGAGVSQYYNYPARIVSNIRVADSIKGLNKSSFLSGAEKYADKKGNILPRITGYYTDENGAAVESRIRQRLVLADITVINRENEEITDYLDYHIDILTKDKSGELKYSEYYSKDEEHNDDNDYAVYIDGASAGSDETDFRTIALKPNETKTVTVGFLCDEQQIPNAYISTMCGNNEEALKYFKKHRPDMMYFSVKVIG